MASPAPSLPHAPPRRLDQVRQAVRARPYSLRTEDTDVRWVQRCMRLHDKRHPRARGLQEGQQLLTPLAVDGQVAASTQSQALRARRFRYQQVLKQESGWWEAVVRAQHPQRLPVVLTQADVAAVLRQWSGTPWLMATLLYGAGLRLMECLRLRVKDIDCAYNPIILRNGKGQRDRVTMLSQQVKEPLQQHLCTVTQLHEQDLQAGAGRVSLPYALEHKYPNANREWIWQDVFPARKPSRDPRTGMVWRHHAHRLV